MSYDVAVIGAGVTGLSVAWHMAVDRSVVVADGAGIGAGASSIQPGGVRQQWGTRISCQLAAESFAFYESFDDRLAPKVSPLLTKCGYLFVAESEEGLSGLRRNVELQNSEGIPSRLVSSEKAQELVPALRPEGIAGAAWYDQDGYFDRPLAVVAGFHDAARRLGVEHVPHHVQSLQRDGSGWRLTLEHADPICAATVVLAASYASPALLAPKGIDVPITREPRYLFYSNPIGQRLLDPLAVFVDRHFASKQLADGSVLASDLTAGGTPGTGREDWYRHVKESIRDRLPVLDFVSFPILVEGFYDVTPDRQPIVGPVPGCDGLWIAAGLNGRGLMLAPAVGRLLAEAVETGTLPEPLPAFALERFAIDELNPEPQVV